MAMIYTLVTSAKEWLSEHFGQDSTTEDAQAEEAAKDDVWLFFFFSISSLDKVLSIQSINSLLTKCQLCKGLQNLVNLLILSLMVEGLCLYSTRVFLCYLFVFQELLQTPGLSIFSFQIVIPHGEPVTVDTFLAWRERFEAELALERAK